MRAAWVARLDETIARCAQPPVLVAHSLGCPTLAHWVAAGELIVRLRSERSGYGRSVEPSASRRVSYGRCGRGRGAARERENADGR